MSSTASHRHFGAAALLLAGCLAPATFAAAQASNAPANPRNFSTFQLILDRNIFNPNRRPPPPPGARIEAPRPARVERFNLVGTLISETGSFAFFDGSESRYQTVLKPSERLGDLQVEFITPERVCFRSPSNHYELTMDLQMQRAEGGAWQLAALPPIPESDRASARPPDRASSSPPGPGAFFSSSAPGAFPSMPAAGDASRRSSRRDRGGEPDFQPSRSAPSPAAEAAPPSSPSSGASEDEVLKRLMEKRQQETN
ncbi:MAG TPA: hypothetical protein P5555_10960 [Candidatus Paceibacterota bacterium]|nr:hypothetical protein [Verrucomicrobiota bacterium]HRZ45698.1 hypothetical protein [Candidatus Paceibacterota bacterium]